MAAADISFVGGLRGAASIVFAIMARSSGTVFEHDIFHMIFFIVLFSILLQGTLLPVCSENAPYD